MRHWWQGLRTWEKCWLVFLFAVQVGFGLWGKSYFPMSSWNLYSRRPHIDTVYAYRIEARKPGEDFQPIPRHLKPFNETVQNHALRIHFLEGQIEPIRDRLRSLLTYAESEHLNYEALRYVRFHLVNRDQNKSDVEMEVIVEVER